MRGSPSVVTPPRRGISQLSRRWRRRRRSRRRPGEDGVDAMRRRLLGDVAGRALRRGHRKSHRRSAPLRLVPARRSMAITGGVLRARTSRVCISSRSGRRSRPGRRCRPGRNRPCLAAALDFTTKRCVPPASNVASAKFPVTSRTAPTPSMPLSFVPFPEGELVIIVPSAPSSRAVAMPSASPDRRRT